jgi:hypothetical protein
VLHQRAMGVGLTVLQPVGRRPGLMPGIGGKAVQNILEPPCFGIAEQSF